MRRLVATIVLLALYVAGSAFARQQQLQEAPNGANLEVPKRIDFDEPRGYWEAIPWIAASELAGPARFILDEESLQWMAYGASVPELEAAHEAGVRFAADPTAEPPEIVHWNRVPGTAVTRPDGHLSSFQELVDSSRFVAVGTVRESVSGFAYGDPGQMLVVEVEEWHGIERPQPEEVLLFWPGGEIEIGFATIFATVSGVPLPPRVGEQVAMFPEKGAVRPNHFVDFLGSRFEQVGAAAKFGADGQMHVADDMARYVPSIVGIGSASAFAVQVNTAIARGAKR